MPVHEGMSVGEEGVTDRRPDPFLLSHALVCGGTTHTHMPIQFFTHMSPPHPSLSSTPIPTHTLPSIHNLTPHAPGVGAALPDGRLRHVVAHPPQGGAGADGPGHLEFSGGQHLLVCVCVSVC